MDLQLELLGNCSLVFKKSVYVAIVYRTLWRTMQTIQDSSTEVFIISVHLSLQTILAKPSGRGLKTPVGHYHTPVGFSDCFDIDLSVLEFLSIDLLGLYIFLVASFCL